MRRFHTLKLYSVEVCFSQICTFATLEENIRQKTIVFALYLYIGQICMFKKANFNIQF